MEENKMERTEFNILDWDDFFRQVNLADKNHISFAKFVGDTEIFCKNEKDDIIDENLTRYRKI